MSTTTTKKKGKIALDFIDLPDFSKAELEDEEVPSLAKSIMNSINQNQVHRLAFEADPSQSTNYYSVYKAKTKLIPNKILKRLAIVDDLVAAIIQSRQNQISCFGRPRMDRFEMGFVVELKQSAIRMIDGEKNEELKEQRKQELQKRIAGVTKKFLNCGSNKGWHDDEKLAFPQYLSQIARNILVVGMAATEIVWVDDINGGKKFHSFRVIDAGTIYKALPQKSSVEAVRQSARHLLEQLKNEKLVPERFENDEYAWVQVIDERPVQAFTSKECLVHNFYSVPDVEMDGYPVTPLDTVISAVTTHINITTHNKLYFQNGRAARGMLVFTSDDINQQDVAQIKQQFNASINSVNNSWRMPVFAVGVGETISWQPIDNSSRDAEFQYLMDMNARVILTAFQMSPEELPGWSYLSRGTNSQALSESNNEFKIVAARDMGLVPLIRSIEDFLNQSIFPLIDPELAEICTVRLMGLDAETAEKESVRFQQDMQIHLTMDDILQKVEKDPIGKDFGGQFLFNPMFQAILDKYWTVGQIKEHFFGHRGASQDPKWDYVRDPFYQAQQDKLMQMQQMQAQMQMQQAAPGAPPEDGSPQGGQDMGGAPQEGQQEPEQGVMTEKQKSDAQESSSASGGEDLSRSLDIAIDLLTKSEAKMPLSKRKLLAHHKSTVNSILNDWEEDLKEINKEVIEITKHFTPKHGK